MRARLQGNNEVKEHAHADTDTHAHKEPDEEKEGFARTHARTHHTNANTTGAIARRATASRDVCVITRYRSSRTPMRET